MVHRMRERRITHRRLRRSSEGKIFAGVCGGIADWLGWDVTLVRLGTLAIAAFTSVFPVVLLYALLAFIVPENTTPAYAEGWDDLSDLR